MHILLSATVFSGKKFFICLGGPSSLHWRIEYLERNSRFGIEKVMLRMRKTKKRLFLEKFFFLFGLFCQVLWKMRKKVETRRKLHEGIEKPDDDFWRKFFSKKIWGKIFQLKKKQQIFSEFKSMKWWNLSHFLPKKFKGSQNTSSFQNFSISSLWSKR